MIISHSHKFIFLKTRKTASTSIDIALSQYCGPEDVITYLNKHDESLKRSLGHKPAQNFMVPFGRWTPVDFVKLLFKGRRPRYTEHMSAESLKRRIDRSTWNTYFKFCVERNPFDKAVSLYYWRTRSVSAKPSLEEFLKTVDDRSLSNIDIYTVNGRIEVDHIIRYENLKEGLETVCASLGFRPLELPRAKSGMRKSRAHYRDLMTLEARSIVERVCSREIEMLDYEY